MTGSEGTILTVTAVDATTGTVSFTVSRQYLDDALQDSLQRLISSEIQVTIADDDAVQEKMIRI